MATLDGEQLPLAAGDCLVVPPGVPFRIAAGADGFDGGVRHGRGRAGDPAPRRAHVQPPWAA